MQINEEGRLSPVNFCYSPNFDERPFLQEINLLVLHNISLPPAQFGTEDVIHFFRNQLSVAKHPYFAEIAHLRVSSHLFIRREGEILQFVPFTKRAWHAGQSSFQGQENCNDYSIGIELEGTDFLPYTESQYQVLAEITSLLCTAYPQITPERIVGHSDIAPLRKTDPGPAFKWEYFRKLINIQP